jgi:hypothetical protein
MLVIVLRVGIDLGSAMGLLEAIVPNASSAL